MNFQELLVTVHAIKKKSSVPIGKDVILVGIPY